MRVVSFMVFMAAIMMAGFSAMAVAGEAEEGELLYKKHCRSCHKLTDQLSAGPGFKGVTERYPEAWMDNWIKNPKELIASGDKIAINLKAQFKSLMPTIKAMQDDEARKSVIAFLKRNDGAGGE